jgi:medium-chain acyl-[acyl-carrier-protein] hydrolase
MSCCAFPARASITLRDCRVAIGNDMTVEGRWVVDVPGYPDPAVPVLYCLPAAGAGPASFRTWRSSLPDGMRLGLVRLPGREIRLNEEPFTSFDQLIPALLAAIREHLDGPYAVLGHCSGALVSFELVRALEGAGATLPRALIVIGRRPPDIPFQVRMSELPSEELVDYMRQMGGTRDEVLADDELRDMVLRTLRADLALEESYAFRDSGRLTCPILAVAGSNDHVLPASSLADWQKHTSGRFRLCVLPGDHFLIGRQPGDLMNLAAAELRT